MNRSVLLTVFGVFCAVAAEKGKWDIGHLKSSCRFPNALTLVSTPRQEIVDENNCNSEYNKADWQQEPKVSFRNAQHDKKYTLICVDPDPPAYEDGEYWLHWLVSNIKGDDFAKGDLSKAKHLTSYYGPAPPSGSGVHRYIFLAFEENGDNIVLNNPDARGNFELGPWLERHPKLRGPVAGVQFRTQY